MRVLDQNNLFEKNNYEINLEAKIITKIVRNAVVMDNDNWIYEMLKCRCS